MKHIFLAAAMLVAASSLGFGQTPRNNTGRAGNDEQAVRQLLNDFGAALSRNDAAALDRFYSEDITIVPPTGALETKAQRLAAIRSGDLRFESFSYDEVGNIRRYGNTAVVTARATVRGQNRGQAINEQTRVTLTLVRTRGRWQIVATQGTRIAGQQQ